jgi:hypothetical protein
MPVTVAEQTIHTLEFMREEVIAAPIDVVFETMLEELGPNNMRPDGEPLSMKLEAWPGGRWMRDLGDGAGHWWGNVQAIKAPALLEISGPLFMSYPSMNNVQYRLKEENGATRLTLCIAGSPTSHSIRRSPSNGKASRAAGAA